MKHEAMLRNDEGWLYVMHNPAFPGVVKVGRTQFLRLFLQLGSLAGRVKRKIHDKQPITSVLAPLPPTRHSGAGFDEGDGPEPEGSRISACQTGRVWFERILGLAGARRVATDEGLRAANVEGHSVVAKKAAAPSVQRPVAKKMAGKKAPS
ncbi:hypothetical protein [Paraburkholderia sp. DGU8]|uniref:hypothetical protein n=1 Tax=Paraburkholderia sp. DGU8 TaxID=3161997 RepID=UPI003467E686